MGVSIGTVTGTGTATIGHTATAARVGGMASGCAAVMARPIGTAIIEGAAMVIIVGAAVRSALCRTVVGGTSAERERQSETQVTLRHPVPERRCVRAGPALGPRIAVDGLKY